MTTLAEAGAPASQSAPARQRFSTAARGGALLFVLFAMLYLGVALALHRLGYVNLDANSRAAFAGYTVMSRQPHLGAIGFVWQPLPGLVQIPLLPAHVWWPSLKTEGFAAAVQSALFMAGAVVLIRRIALDRGASTTVRWLAVAAFGLHPMVILYGANGMSEASALFLLTWACRRLLRWIQTGAVTDAAVCGIAVALTFLSRYEAVVVAACVAVTIFAISTVRNRGNGGLRVAAGFGVHDAAVFWLPTLGAVVTWHATGWLLTGNAMAPLASHFGNRAHVEASDVGGTRDALGAIGTSETIAATVFGMQPLIFVVLAIVAARAVRLRNIDIIAPMAVFGSLLVAHSAAIYLTSTVGWFRFFISAVPLTVVALLVVSGSPRSPGQPGPATGTRWAAPVLAAVLMSSLPVAWSSMLNPAVGKEELPLRSVIWPDQHARDNYRALWTADMARDTARWFDDQQLPPGSVVANMFPLGATWLASENPEQWVLRSDYDFFTKLNHPDETGVRYIVVSAPSGLSDLDAINNRYPTLWEDGAGFATLVLKVTDPRGNEQFRVYRINGSSVQ